MSNQQWAGMRSGHPHGMGLDYGPPPRQHFPPGSHVPRHSYHSHPLVSPRYSWNHPYITNQHAFNGGSPYQAAGGPNRATNMYTAQTAHVGQPAHPAYPAPSLQQHAPPTLLHQGHPSHGVYEYENQTTTSTSTRTSTVRDGPLVPASSSSARVASFAEWPTY